MKNSTTFRLKGKKKQGTYSLTRGIASRDGVLKKISYRPGASSIFDDDNKESAAKPKSVVFKYNNKKHDPAVEITVPHSNGLLLNFLTTHKKFNRDYEVYDVDAIAEGKVNHFNNVEKALGYVSEGTDDEIKAAALTVFGFNYFSKSTAVCRVDLKEKAVNSPDEIIKAYEHKNFQNKYIVSLLYCTGVIVNNGTHTAVQWADTGNTILTIATGESGIEKLTEFISRENSDSITLLQEFQARYEKIAADKKNANLTQEKAAKVISSQESEIEKLKRELVEAKEENAKLKEPAEDKYKDLTLEQAVALYKEQKNQEVPTAKAANLAWIVKQIQ